MTPPPFNTAQQAPNTSRPTVSDPPPVQPPSDPLEAATPPARYRATDDPV